MTDPMHLPDPPDVVVVGAGPTGLMLAGDLAAAGVRVTLLDKREQESNLTRAFAVHARTLEQLDARGLADRLVETGNPVCALRLFGSVSVDLSSLPTRFPYVLITAQYHVEELLTERAVACGVAIVRGADVSGLEQDGTDVRIAYDTAAGPQTVRAAYVVGCDGHRSRVRESLGLDFPGESVVRSLMLADVRLDHPPADLLTIQGNREGFCFVVPFGDGWFRVIARDPHHEVDDDVAVTLDEIADVVGRVLGTDLGFRETRWTSRLHSDERQVRRYRVGRVLLAGDAAHVHSPAGGMGMNTGLQDAANLGWKLAAVLRGSGDDALLDSYDAERRPVGAMVLRTSGGLIRAALLRNRALTALRRFGLRLALATGPVGRRIRGRLSGIGIRYQAPDGADPAVGTRAADVTGTDGRRLYEVLRDARAVLLLGPGEPPPAGADGLRVLVAPGVDRARLVRPDGYVAWVEGSTESLSGALSRWGLPAA